MSTLKAALATFVIMSIAFGISFYPAQTFMLITVCGFAYIISSTVYKLFNYFKDDVFNDDTEHGFFI